MSDFPNTLLKIEASAHGGAFGNNPIPEPTESQCLAGNYKMGRVNLYGLPIAIEQPRGSYRSGIDQKTGKRWTSRVAAHYGYINGTKAADGDCVDCFIGVYPQSETIYVINQFIDGRFDEHKSMLGFPDENSARSAYLSSYERGWNGMESIVPMSIYQFKWWLKNGEMSQPVRANNLPNEGLEAMKKRVQWDSEALPIGVAIDQLLYQIRQSEETGNVLLLDSVSMGEIIEDSDGILALDALVTPYAKLNRKMELLRGVMERAGNTVKPISMQITDPFKQLGKTNVAVIFELSDGQTISIFFHNPDVTPNKILPTDDLISWKWLLNKKDITIVVAPERGMDLNIREVSRRIMKLAEKNSAAFARANQKRSERMQSIQSLKTEISDLERQLESAQRDFEVAKVEYEDKNNAALKAKDDFAQEILKSLIDDFGWKNQGTGQALFWVTKEIGGGVVSMMNNGGIRRLAARIMGGKIEATFGDNPLVSVDLKSDESAKENAKRLDEAVNAIDPNFTVKTQENPIFDPTTPENYAKVMADPELQLKYQDRLDAFFQGRIVAVNNALMAANWYHPGGNKQILSKLIGEDSMESGLVYSVTMDFAQVGAGKNVVGVTYNLSHTVGHGVNAKMSEFTLIRDDLSKTPEQIAAEIDGSVAALSGTEIGGRVAEFDANNSPMSFEEFKKNANVFRQGSNAYVVNKYPGSLPESFFADGRVTVPTGWEGKERTDGEILEEAYRVKYGKVNDAGETNKKQAQQSLEILQSIVDGKHDGDDLTELLGKIEAAATALSDDGLADQYDQLIGAAAEKWAELDQIANG